MMASARRLATSTLTGRPTMAAYTLLTETLALKASSFCSRARCWTASRNLGPRVTVEAMGYPRSRCMRTRDGTFDLCVDMTPT